MTAAPTQRAFDREISTIAEYVAGHGIVSKSAFNTAHLCLLDCLGCALAALAVPECTKMLGPVVPGTLVPHGARVPGTSYVLDPVKAAFDTGALIRWLDYNDTFYGETVVHPSDTLGAILAAADWASRTRVAGGKAPVMMRDVLDAAIRAYEIAGVLALGNAVTTRWKLDHVMLIKIACAAVVTKLLGGTREEIGNAVSHAWIDGHALAIYRRSADTGARKSWASADAGARGVSLALLALRGETGCAGALAAPTWGFQDVCARGERLAIARPYGSYVMENVQFKLAYPAAFHAQTAAEAAISLHAQVRDRLDEIERVELWTHGYALAYLARSGVLRNFAERDHCLQYIAAVGLIFGDLRAGDYEDDVAGDPRIDRLREKMTVSEDERATRGFLDARKRSNANAVRVHFRDGSATPRVDVEYPIGHPRRRHAALPLMMQKFDAGLARVYPPLRRVQVARMCGDRGQLCALPVHEFMDALAL